jgi:hypothetical protein
LKVVHSVLGNNDDNLAGRPVLSKFHPDDRARATEAFSHLLNNPSQPVTVELRVGDSAGEWHWMEVEMTDMLDDPDVQAIDEQPGDHLEEVASRSRRMPMRSEPAMNGIANF